MNRKLRAALALAAIPAAIAVTATAASAATGWHASTAGTAAARSGTWSTASATLTCQGMTALNWAAKQGDQTSCSLQVTNTSTASETIVLTASAFTAAHPVTQSLATPTTFTLAAGASATDTLSASVPANATLGAQNATITAKVGSTTVATITETVTVSS
jgi:hypothetical protein